MVRRTPDIDERSYRLRDAREIENLVVVWSGQAPVRIRDLATVRAGEAPPLSQGPSFCIVISAGRVDATEKGLAGR
jgi:hypothetical protein